MKNVRAWNQAFCVRACVSVCICVCLCVCVLCLCECLVIYTNTYTKTKTFEEYLKYYCGSAILYFISVDPKQSFMYFQGAIWTPSDNNWFTHYLSLDRERNLS